MKKVLIVGSFPTSDYVDGGVPEDKFENELETNTEFREAFEAFQSSCGQLGKSLAKRGVMIFVGSSRRIDADTYVIAGANEVKGKHQVVIYTPNDHPYPAFITEWSDFNNIEPDYRRVPGPWHNATTHVIGSVDAVIVIGGGMSTLQAGMAAPALKKPVVALTAFRGAAKPVFEFFHGNYLESGMSWEAFEALQRPFTTLDEAEKIVTAVDNFAEKRPYNVATGLTKRFAVLLAVVLLIISWAMVLHFGSKQSEALGPASIARESSNSEATEGVGQGSAPNRSPENRGGGTKNTIDSGKDGGDGSQPDEVGTEKSNPDVLDLARADRRSPDKPPVAALPVSGPDLTDDTPSDDQADANARPNGSIALSRVAQDLGNSTNVLILILVISALLGTALRSGMRLLQDQMVTWGDIVNEVIVGVLLSFSLLILYLAAGMLYEGNVLEVSPSNFRRLAVTVSAIALATAFLLEQAASEVRRRFGQTLQR